MATINYLYRSTKPEAKLNIRLLFRHEGNDYQIGGKTEIEVSKDYWKNKHSRTNFGSSIEDQDLEDEVDAVKKKMKALDKDIFKAFNDTDPEKVNKDWLKKIIYLHNNPPIKSPEIPRELLSFIDYYLEQNKHDLTAVRKRRIKVVKNKLQRFEKEQNTVLHISSIHDNFKNKYTDYCNTQEYSFSTQQTDLKTIKTICFYARKKGLDTSRDLDGLRLKGNDNAIKSVYLTFEELDIIEDQIFSKDYLDNARDWLLISCYTGQRVSDFMRFTSEMIRFENEKYFLEFKQQKTGKQMTIPFIKEAREVLKKRGGEFPRAISHQKYNEYIKEVCKLAGLNELTEGKIIKCIAEEGAKPTKSDYRRITGTFEKWELISSHIGRRSFSTNYYGKIPTPYLIRVTGHSTERMFLSYIKKSDKDLAAEAYNYF